MVNNLKAITYKELDAWIFDNSEHIILSESGAREIFSLLSVRGEYLLLDEENGMFYMHIPGFSEPVRVTFEEIVCEVREIYSHELHRTEEKLRKLRGLEYGSYKKVYENLLAQGEELSFIELCNARYLKEVRV